MKPLHLFSPTYRVDECLAEVRQCLETGWTGSGAKTLLFENQWCTYTELPHAHFVSSATAGLHLAVRLLKEANNWSDGDEVITTPLTFVSTNHALLYESLRPVFADVDEYLCLDPESIEQRITDKTRAVMFVGIGGNSGRLEDIAKLCRQRGLKLVLDAAHMSGTRLNGRHVGHQADAAVFSFHAVKNLPTADGGMLCLSDQALDEQARQWSWLGINKDTFTRTTEPGTYRWQYDVVHEGFKYHGNSIMASLGLVALRYLDADNDRRRELAALYDHFIDDCIERIATSPGCLPSRHLYQVQVDSREEVMLALNQQGIYPGVHYRDNTEYRMYNYAEGSCPAAARASKRLISLPLHLQLTEKDAERIANSLNMVVENIRAPQAVCRS